MRITYSTHSDSPLVNRREAFAVLAGMGSIRVNGPGGTALVYWGHDKLVVSAGDYTPIGRVEGMAEAMELAEAFAENGKVTP
jgi:hypothetical protein